MKAHEVKVGEKVSAMVSRGPKNTKKMTGTVIGIKVSDGDEVVAVEWDDGKLQKMNVNDLEFVDMEEDFKMIASKIHEAANLLSEANELATKHQTSLSNLFYTNNEHAGYGEFRHLFNELDAGGWRASTMLCS